MQLTIEIANPKQAYEVWVALYNRAIDLEAAHETHPNSGFDQRAIYMRSLADIVKPLKTGGDYAVGKGAEGKAERAGTTGRVSKRSRKARHGRRI